MKNDKPETDEELATQMRGLVKWILDHCENPHAWPLTDELRVQFLRSAYFQALNIRDSEPFLRAQVVKATTEYTELTNQRLVDEHRRHAAQARAMLDNGGHGPNASQRKKIDALLRSIAGLPAE